jgi:8-oxo-dGTP pyrophosphatase MutT (NUDIX family)
MVAQGDRRLPSSILWVVDESQFARWLREGTREEGDPIPAATVVLVRETASGVETLMLRKNSKLAFGGMWVFPGGRIDDADREGAADLESAARRAAVREAAEEADLVVDAGSLAWISHWVPPGLAPKRYATWFFVAPAPEGAVTIDGGEIHDSAWMRPADALERRDRSEIELAPPTWVTLHYLAEFPSVGALMQDARAVVPFHYETRITRGAEGMVALWRGDVAYGGDDPDVPGSRHRLWMLDGGWRLERTV